VVFEIYGTFSPFALKNKPFMQWLSAKLILMYNNVMELFLRKRKDGQADV